MNVNYIERKILSEESIDKIKDLISMCEWKDGLVSTTGMNHAIKKNFEVVPSNLRFQISSIIMKSLDCDNQFMNFCAPKESGECIVSKTLKGGYYNPHRDYGISGDFSTTVFISDPEDYGGGELCLYLDGHEKKFKPKSGTAITYKTGVLHRVNEVSYGERIVCVLWTKSGLKDNNIRNIYSNLLNVVDIMKKSNIEELTHKNFDHIFEDPLFILNDLIEDIRRNYFL